MNILDNMLLIILLIVLLGYCYKKGKFPFGRKQKQGGKDVPAAKPDIAFPEQIGCGIPCTPSGSTVPITRCRVLPCTFAFEWRDETAAEFQEKLNAELSDLDDRGYIVTAVDAVPVPGMGSNCRILLFVIKAGYGFPTDE